MKRRKVEELLKCEWMRGMYDNVCKTTPIARIFYHGERSEYEDFCLEHLLLVLKRKENQEISSIDFHWRN